MATVLIAIVSNGRSAVTAIQVPDDLMGANVPSWRNDQRQDMAVSQVSTAFTQLYISLLGAR